MVVLVHGHPAEAPLLPSVAPPPGVDSICKGVARNTRFCHADCTVLHYVTNTLIPRPRPTPRRGLHLQGRGSQLPVLSCRLHSTALRYQYLNPPPSPHPQAWTPSARAWLATRGLRSWTSAARAATTRRRGTWRRWVARCVHVTCRGRAGTWCRGFRRVRAAKARRRGTWQRWVACRLLRDAGSWGAGQPQGRRGSRGNDGGGAPGGGGWRPVFGRDAQGPVQARAAGGFGG